jgi:hypothetical protein
MKGDVLRIWGLHSRHKNDKVCQVETLVMFLENNHKLYLYVEIMFK